MKNNYFPEKCLGQLWSDTGGTDPSLCSQWDVIAISPDLSRWKEHSSFNIQIVIKSHFADQKKPIFWFIISFHWIYLSSGFWHPGGRYVICWILALWRPPIPQCKLGVASPGPLALLCLVLWAETLVAPCSPRSPAKTRPWWGQTGIGTKSNRPCC